MSNRKALAEPDGTGPYGLGHRCQHCGTRIDIDPAGDGGWIHDHTGYRKCADDDRHQHAAQLQRAARQAAEAAHRRQQRQRRGRRRQDISRLQVAGPGMMRLPAARAASLKTSEEDGQQAHHV